jgi:transcription antitermination factor NusG
MTAWYAVQTKSRGEQEAHVNLKRQGFMSFYPFRRVRDRRKVPGRAQWRVEWKDVPYFTGYIFVAIRHAGESIADVNDTDGVICVVSPGRGKDPLRIPDKVIDALMSLGENGLIGEDDMTRWSARFFGKKGQNFVFGKGSAFEGLLGTIASIKDMDKTGEIAAWVDGFGRRVEMRVPVKQVGELV